MKRISFFYTLVICVMLVFLLSSPPLIVDSKSLQQNSSQVQATGQICPLDGGSCGNFVFSFNPQGGPVSGSYHVTYPAIASDGSNIGTYDENGTLKGSFSGGDGGSITGTFHAHASLTNGGNPIDYDGTWKGKLHSDGTTSGTISAKGLTNSWSATFSPVEFKTDTNSATNSENPTATQGSILLPTATSFDVVGSKIDLFPEAKAFINSSPILDDAVKGILNQDATIIARDNNNNFFAIGNNGKALALPAALNSIFIMSNQFAILGNDRLLASSEHSSVRGTINGGGDFVKLEKMPGDLKNHDYTMMATNCSSPTSCNPVMLINSAASSTKVAATCLLSPKTGSTQTNNNQNKTYYISSEGGRIPSSEHGSCRGTINGGGDFIYQPPPLITASLLYQFLAAQQNTSMPGFLGILVENKTNGAEVKQIQAGSPAENAGLKTGDLITKISGVSLDDQHTLDSVFGQFKGGDKISLGLIRNGKSTTINVTLANMDLPVIVTPTAGILLSNNSEVLIDIGFNGATGVLVLTDSVVVREKVTGTSVTVPAGSALIVIPGEAVGKPFAVSDSDINKWWENPPTDPNNSPNSANPSPQSSSTNSIKTNKDFNPIPGVDGATVYWGGWIVIAILYFIIFIAKLIKKP